MEIALIVNNCITRIIDTTSPDKYLEKGWIEIPEGLDIGTDIRMFNIVGDRWMYKSEDQLIKEGLLTPQHVPSESSIEQRIELVRNKRAEEYANLYTGVDKLVSEYQRLLIIGASDDELSSVKNQLISRYKEIKNNNPYPER